MTEQFNRNRGVAQALALVAAAMVVVVMSGCDTTDWEDPDEVAQLLEQGTLAQQGQAVERLGDMSAEQRDVIAGPAANLYLEDEHLRSDIMRRLIEWRHPDAKDAYVEEMVGDHAGYGAAAARILGELQLEEAVPAMLEVFEEATDHERQIGILRGLAYMPDSGALDEALEVLQLDVDNYTIRLHRAACEFIGSLAMVEPEAIDAGVRSELARARMLMSADGRTVDEECGLAIQQVGFAMIPELIELFHEENDDVKWLLLTYDNPSGGEYFPQNEAKLTAARQLSAMRAPEAVELFNEQLMATVEQPEGLDEGSLRNWRVNEAETLNEMIKGLGDIGDPDGRATLEAIAQGEPFSDEWEPVIDGTVAFQMLQDSARALARLGDRDARSTLLEMTEAEIIPEMAARFQYLEEQEDHEVPMTEQLRPQWVAAQSFAYLGESDDRDEIESLVEAIEEDMEDEELAEKLESFLVAFDVMDECQEIGDEARRAECFGEFLEDDSEIAREKAVLELSRMSSGAAGPVVVDAIGTDDLELRELLTFAGYRVPTPELADRIQEIVEEEAGRTSTEYQRDHLRLRMLHAWLQHQDEDDVVAN